MSVSVGSWPFGISSMRRPWQASFGGANGREEALRLRPASDRAATEILLANPRQNMPTWTWAD
eukprot:7032586-Lingulodinium_polyedra.AAC.1